MYLTGVLTVLNTIDKSIRNYAIKGCINSVRWSIRSLLTMIKDTDYEYSFYGSQKDGKYECKESNQ